MRRPLKLATENNDRNFVANTLASLSLQATYEERSLADAVSLARAAQDACRPVATPRVLAMLSMREAFAHAALGDASGCRAAITEAHRQLQRADSWPEDPAWVGYFDERKLLVDTGIALSKLGDVDAAGPIIAQAVAEADPANARNCAFHTFWLATTELAAGRIDEACATATRTLEVAEGVDSPRIIGHVRELQAQLVLQPHFVMVSGTGAATA